MTPRSKSEPLLVDARGLKCPWPVLRAARAMREHRDIALLSDDPVALTDVPVLAETHGWSIEVTNHGDFNHFRIIKPESQESAPLNQSLPEHSIVDGRKDAAI